MKTFSILLVLAHALQAQSLFVQNRSVVIGTDQCILSSPPSNTPFEAQVSVFSTSGSVPFIAAADPSAGWLRVEPQLGTAVPGGTAVTIRAFPAGLRFGTQKAYVAIAPQADTSQTVVLTVTVSCFPTPTLFFELNTLQVSVPAGSPAAAYPVRLLTNQNPQSPPQDGIVRFAIGRSAPGAPRNWIVSAALPGQSGDQGQIALGQTDLLSVRIDPAGLSPGSYDGFLRLRDTQAQQSSADLYIALTVTQPSAALQVSTNLIEFRAEAGGGQPAAFTLAVGTTAGSLAARATPRPQSGTWLLVNGSRSAVDLAAPGNLIVSVSTLGLPPGTYTGTILLDPGAISIPVQLVIAQSTLPSVTAVQNGASFTGPISPGAWVMITGDNLAPDTTAAEGRVWRAEEIVGGSLPTTLDNVRVTIDGKQAYIYYISRQQINAQAPADIRTGNAVPVTVTTSRGVSNTASAVVQAVAPAFFMLGATRGVVALWYRGSTFGVIGDGVSFPGTTPARPGDVVALYANGFGPALPDVGAGRTFGAASTLPSPVRVTLGDRVFSVPGFLVSPGLYQINLTLPQDFPAGDHSVVAEYAGFRTQENVRISVRR